MVELTKMQILQQNNLYNSRWTQAFENNGDGNPIYWGEAEPGSAKSSAVWRIKKLTWSGSSVTDIQWADGTTGFSKVWDDRASYTYS